MNAGEGVEYIFTKTHHNNPLYRVVPKAFVEENGDFNYDKEKYRDMLLKPPKRYCQFLASIEWPTGTCRKNTRNGVSDLTKRN